METAIGVFDSRSGAQEAVQELLDRNLPRDAIVFLTRSESDARSMARLLTSYAGTLVAEAVNASLGPGASILLIPALGRVFSVGYAAASLLGMSSDRRNTLAEPTPQEEATHESALFRSILQQRHSIVLVRTESRELARAACEVLDRRALGMGRPA